MTCRDLLRVIPSHWQTTIKNGGTVAVRPSYVQLLLADEEDEDEDKHRYASGFWRHHDLPRDRGELGGRRSAWRTSCW